MLYRLLRFSVLLVGLAIGLLAPPFAGGQTPAKVPRIGLLQPARTGNFVAFADALRDAGYGDGQNVVLETRFYGTSLGLVVEFAKELVALKCDVIVASGPYAIQAATTATSTIPIVGIDLESDPVLRGWAKTLSRPGGNLTGLFLDLPELGGKQIQFLAEAVPGISRVGVVWDATIGDVQFRATEAAARRAAVTVQSLPIKSAGDFKDAFDRAVRERVKGVIVLSSPLMFVERSQIAGLALKARLPTISLLNQFPDAGGLMAYGPDLADMLRRAVIHVDRILKGAKPGDLPIERPVKLELVINVRTAKALGLAIPSALLLRADRIIE